MHVQLVLLVLVLTYKENFSSYDHGKLVQLMDKDKKKFAETYILPSIS